VTAVAAQARELELAQPTLGSILRSGAPRFAREGFGPVLVFYAGWKINGLVTGVVLSTVAALGLEWYERRHGRRGVLALVSAAFVVVQAVVGIVADSAVVYLAQPVLVSAIWGVACLVSVAIGRPLMGVFADAWYPFPPEVKRSTTYRRVFGVESIVWAAYFIARSAIRMLVLWTGSIGLFLAVQIATGIPVLALLVLWSVWYSLRAFARSTEWDVTSEPPPPPPVRS
jgi:intracellular septation protein A